MFLGVSKAIVSEFNTPASRQEMVDLINAVPPILQGLAGPVVNVGTMGGYLAVQVRHVLPGHPQPVVDPGAVGHARLRKRGAAASTSSPRRPSQARIALEKLSGHLTGWPSRSS